MPELPEVEVTRRALAPQVVGRAVQAVAVRDARLRWPVPPDLEQRMGGATVRALERRGKYLLWRFDHGTLVAHLGMSGVWRLLPAAPQEPRYPAPRRHDHVDLAFADRLARYTDPRRFGALLWHAAADGPIDTHPLLAGLGIEPFDVRFDGVWLHAGTRGRTAPIKQVLLAGDVVVGVGNIYASESLFRAGLNPLQPAWRIGPARAARLATAIRAVLAEAIGVGGSTLRDFVSAAGDAGYFMLDAMVYERGGQPCKVCGTPIRRIVQGQRATYYCPHCQRR